MGFNRQKMELERKTEAEKQARARRALDVQILEDAQRLVAAWNERQEGRMPMLFAQQSAPPSWPSNGFCTSGAPPAALQAMSTFVCSIGTGMLQ